MAHPTIKQQDNRHEVHEKEELIRVSWYVDKEVRVIKKVTTDVKEVKVDMKKLRVTMGD